MVHRTQEMRRAESGVDDDSRVVVTLKFLGGVDHLLLTRRNTADDAQIIA